MTSDDARSETAAPPRRPLRDRLLDAIEWAGNRLPDPAMLFVLALAATWVVSLLLAPVQFTEIDPRTLGPDAHGQPQPPRPIEVKNQLSGPALATFLTRLVKNFTEFPPLGVVLVAMLGVGVADHTGFINAAVKALLRVTPAWLLTPMLLLVAIISHSAGDTGYVLVIPLGGIIFQAAGRHPLAGIACAFAGVAGGFSANFLPSGLDPLLQGFTQSSAHILDPGRNVNPLCNWWFTSASTLVIIAVGWYLTDRVIERRLRHTPIDGDEARQYQFAELTAREVRGLWAGLGSMLAAGLVVVAAAWPADSPLRSPEGSLVKHGAPLMEAIVPLIFLGFLLPGVVHGYVAGTVRSHRDLVQGMAKAMGTMSYYVVMAFFAAQFTYAFRESNLGALVAIKGAAALERLGLPGAVTVVGIILLTCLVNLLVGSASAKWAMLGPIFVPMLMKLGIAPELTQAAYRIGDSSTNIVTPLLPYFPLIVAYAQRYVKNTGVGTLISLMLPYSLAFVVTWTLLLMVFWGLELPLGLEAAYVYPVAR
jgi:aminobenzoyl-glutamate transport protein